MLFLVTYLLLLTQLSLMCEGSLSQLSSDPGSCQVTEIATSGQSIRSILRHSTQAHTHFVGTEGDLRRISESEEAVLATSGVDYYGNEVSFARISGIAYDSNGDLIFTDSNRYCVRRYYLQNNTQDVYAGKCGVYNNINGHRTNNAVFNQVYDIAADHARERIYITEQGRLKQIDTGNDQVTQLHISFWGYSINQIKGLTVDPSDGTIYFATLTAIYKMAAAWLSPVVLVSGNSQSSGYTDSTLSASRFAGIEGITFSSGLVLVLNPQYDQIRVIDQQSESVDSLFGSATDSDEGLLEDCHAPDLTVVSAAGGELTFADGNDIRTITCASGTTSTESITTTTATPTQTTTETVPTTPATTVTTSTTLETTSTTTATPTTTASTLKTIYKLYFRRENLSTLMVAEQAYSCTGSLIGRAQHTSVKRCALSCLKNMHCICMCYNDRLCSIYGD